MKIASSVFPIVLLASMSAHAQTQDGGQKALQQAATGDSFRIGYTRFQLVPDAAVSAADAGAGAKAVRVGKYAVNLQRSAAKSGTKVQRKFAAAVTDDGRTVVVAPVLNVYHSNVAALQDAARASGGTLVYSSRAGGNGRIEFASVAQAMAAIPRIQAVAGIKQVEPELIQGEEEPQ